MNHASALARVGLVLAMTGLVGCGSDSGATAPATSPSTATGAASPVSPTPTSASTAPSGSLAPSGSASHSAPSGSATPGRLASVQELEANAADLNHADADPLWTGSRSGSAVIRLPRASVNRLIMSASCLGAGGLDVRITDASTGAELLWTRTAGCRGFSYTVESPDATRMRFRAARLKVTAAKGTRWAMVVTSATR